MGSVLVQSGRVPRPVAFFTATGEGKRAMQDIELVAMSVCVGWVAMC